MKRYAILLLALALIGTAGLVCAHRVVSASAEAVEVRETVISGDRAAAEGVEVYFPTESTVHLFWDTGFCVGAENAAETDFRFSPDGEIEQWGPEPKLSLGVPGSMWSSEINPEEQMYPLVSDVVPRAPSDAHSSESVRLRDYFEYMPLHVGWQCSYYTNEYGEEKTYVSSKEMDSEVERQIYRLCAIALPEDYYVKVDVDKDADGKLLGWEVDFRDRMSLSLDYVSASAPQGEWLLTHLRCEPGRYSCEGCDKLWYIPAGDAAAEPVCALELDDGELAQCLEIDALGRPILLLSRDGERYIRVVDGKSGGCVQTLEVPELDAQDRISRLYTGENFVLVKSVKGVFAMYELTESGEYVRRLSGELCAPGVNLTYGDDRMVMQWDGQRLVIAAVVFNLQNPRMRQAQGFMLWDYDARGRDYCALYRSSLSMAEPWADMGIMSYEARELSLR